MQARFIDISAASLQVGTVVLGKDSYKDKLILYTTEADSYSAHKYVSFTEHRAPHFSTGLLASGKYRKN